MNTGVLRFGFLESAPLRVTTGRGFAIKQCLWDGRRDRVGTVDRPVLTTIFHFARNTNFDYYVEPYYTKSEYGMGNELDIAGEPADEALALPG